jgi:hypothetical protein
LVLPEGYYASPKRIVKALEAMKQQKGMKKGFSLGMSEVDHKATLWVRDLSQVIILPPSSVRPGGNTRTENLLPWLRLQRTVLYNLRVENSACRTGTARRLLCIPKENGQSIRSHETPEGNEEGI